MSTAHHRYRPRLCLTVTLVFSVGTPIASCGHQQTAEREVSRELHAMYEADQADRQRGQLSPDRERARLVRVKQLLAMDSLRTGADYYYAGMLFQHSPDRTGRDHLIAHVLATMAAGKGHEPGRWLAAAAFDRFLVFNEMEQFFGTQFERDSTGRWDAGRIDPLRTEAIRSWFNVPTQDSLRRRAVRFQ